MGTKAGTQRRVYVLPDELVGRITAFQEERGLPSETEAVRRLLDEALSSRDTHQNIVDRVIAGLRKVRIPAEAAKDLMGHPLISEVAVGRDEVVFRLKDHFTITVRSDETFEITDPREEHPY